MPASRIASWTAASRRSAAASVTWSTPCALEGPSESSSNRSATDSCGPDEPTLVGSVQSSLVPQVDRDPIHPKQLCDPIGDGAQRVREREVGDRLADHGQEGLGAFEVGGHLGRARARPQSMSGSNPEASETLEHGRRRRRLGGEEELEDAERRIPEPDGDQRGRLWKRLVPRLGDSGLTSSAAARRGPRFPGLVLGPGLRWRRPGRARPRPLGARAVPPRRRSPLRRGA